MIISRIWKNVYSKFEEFNSCIYRSLSKIFFFYFPSSADCFWFVGNFNFLRKKNLMGLWLMQLKKKNQNFMYDWLRWMQNRKYNDFNRYKQVPWSRGEKNEIHDLILSMEFFTTYFRYTYIYIYLSKVIYFTFIIKKRKNWSTLGLHYIFKGLKI